MHFAKSLFPLRNEQDKVKKTANCPFRAVFHNAPAEGHCITLEIVELWKIVEKMILQII